MTDYDTCILYTDGKMVAVNARFNHLLTRISKLEKRITDLEGKEK
ncbi:unnamed protein product [marine sediment metagenome]|uniref:Uncharacterized protein n=1 Tax=marine sediment metagenome TaxID=412755 RepID=X1GCX5_9ZZZZ